MKKAVLLSGLVFLVLASLTACRSQNGQDEPGDVTLSQTLHLDVAEPINVLGTWNQSSYVESSTCPSTYIEGGLATNRLYIRQEGLSVTVTIPAGYPGDWIGDGVVQHRRMAFTVSRTDLDDLCHVFEQYTVEAKFKDRLWGQLTGTGHYVRIVPASCLGSGTTEDAICDMDLVFVARKEPY